MLWKFRHRQMAVMIDDGCLRPCTAERRSRRQQEIYVCVRAAVGGDALHRPEKVPKPLEGRDLHRTLLGQKRTVFAFGETQCSLPGSIADPQQIVDLVERSCGTPLIARHAQLVALDQNTAPSIRCRISDGAEKRFARSGMMRAKGKSERGLQGKARRVFEPGLVVFERGAFSASVVSRPKLSHALRRAFQIDGDEQALVRHCDTFGAMARVRILVRILLGRRSSSSASPTSSVRTSARSARRSVNPRTKRIVA